jgi:hypothetical protein
VVNADDGLASDRSSERHRAARRRQDRVARLGDKINAAVTGCPSERWGSESPLHHGNAAEGPAGRRGQKGSGHRRSRTGKHAQTDRRADGYPNVATQHSNCSRNHAVFDCSLPLAAMFAGLPPSSSDPAERKSGVPPSPPAHSSPLGLVLAALAPSTREHGGARFPAARSKDSHGGSLWTTARIVHPRSNLWMTFEASAGLWIDSPVQICHQV